MSIDDLEFDYNTPIKELMLIYSKIHSQKDILEEKEEQIKNKFKIFLKEKGWQNFKDKDTDISISFSEVKREELDKMQVKLLLNEQQYQQCIKIKTYERLNIMTPELRKKLKKFINNPVKDNLR